MGSNLVGNLLAAVLHLTTCKKIVTEGLTMTAARQTDSNDLFGSFSDDVKRKMSEWNLKALEFEKDRRRNQQLVSDEELRERLAQFVPAEELDAVGVEFYRQMQQLSDDELEQLIEIRKLYLSSSPYASGRIDIYKNISKLAPWDETCLFKIVSEYEQLEEPLNVCDWLAKAALVNPSNASTRSKLEIVSAATAPLRRRVRIVRSIQIASGTCAVLFLVWCTGYRISWDEPKILEAVAAMVDTEIPQDVGKPDHLIRHVYTGYERAQFSNHGGSYLIFITSRFRRLRHLSFPNAELSATEPTTAKTSRFTIRGDEAEFVYEKYNRYSTVLGYFQGKEYPVSFRARFEGADRDTYAVGGPPEWIQTFEPNGPE